MVGFFYIGNLINIWIVMFGTVVASNISNITVFALILNLVLKEEKSGVN